MARLGKVLLFLAAGFVVLVGSTTVLAGIAVYRVCRTGAAWVSVHEKGPSGTHVAIPVPVGLVRTAVAFTPRHELPQMDPEVQEFLPVLRDIARELERAPDGVLVEVDGPDERVLIEKRGGRFVIDVDSAGEHVTVTLPAGALEEITDVVTDLPVRRVGPFRVTTQT
jgi:hypothetical protein